MNEIVKVIVRLFVIIGIICIAIFFFAIFLPSQSELKIRISNCEIQILDEPDLRFSSINIEDSTSTTVISFKNKAKIYNKINICHLDTNLYRIESNYYTLGRLKRNDVLYSLSVYKSQKLNQIEKYNFGLIKSITQFTNDTVISIKQCLPPI